MDRFRGKREDMRRAILEGKAVTAVEERRAAFEGRGGGAVGAYLEKVTRNAWKVTDEDVEAVKRAGKDDPAIFEITVAAAIGQATRQIERALAALAEATSGEGATGGEEGEG